MSDKNLQKKEGNMHNLSFSYVCKKTERIVAALHLITRHIPDEEPIKRQIRSKGLMLLSMSLSLQSGEQSNVEGTATAHEALGLISFLTVALHAQFISEMNHTVLIRELKDIIIFIGKMEEEDQTGPTQSLLPKSFFEVANESEIFAETKGVYEGYTYAVPKQDESYKSHGYKKHIKNDVSYEMEASKIREQEATISTKDNLGLGSEIASRSLEKKKDRRVQILSVLQKKDKVSIKDISSVIKDCSEKTLQRELLKLVEQGVLKKEGERRWSKYSLA